MNQKLLLIDGHYLAFRSFFAFPPNLTGPDGSQINAVYGFINLLLAAVESVKPDYLLICFDRKEPTFRHIAYPEYKAHRPPAPEEFSAQMPVLMAAIESAGIPSYSLKSYEADDLIGTYSQLAEDKSIHTLILSGDMDNMQLVSEFVTVLVPQRGSRELMPFTPDSVKEKYGISPDQIVDYKALKGDSSDNIPGVKGIGDKTAVKLISEFGDLNSIYNQIDRVSSASVKNKLAQDRDNAFLSQQLATIERAVPVVPVIEELSGTLDWSKVLNVLTQFEFASLVKRYSNKLDASEQPSRQLSESPTPSGDYVTIKKAAELSPYINDLKNGFSIDLETTSKSAVLAQLVGVSISYKPDHALYICLNESVKPESEPSGGLLFDTAHERVNLSIPPVLKSLVPILEDPNIPKYTHNGKYEWLVLRRYGICLNGIAYDSMLGAFINEPGQPVGLKDVTKRKLNLTMTTYEEVAGKGKNQQPFQSVDIAAATNYAGADADCTLQICQQFQSDQSDEAKWLMNEMEVPLQDVLAKVEWEGVRIDTAYLNTLSETFKSESEDVKVKIFELAGSPFNLNSPKQVGDVLYNQLGLPVLKKTKTGASTDASVLEKLKHHHPIAEHLLRFRTIEKLLNTYISTLPHLINPDSGRIHTSFSQTVAITGRLSSNNPNLQNIPIRTPEGKQIRKAFIPRNPDYRIMAADYSQIELRILAHLSEDPALIDAFNHDADIHQATAAVVFNVNPEDVTSEQRYKAKAVNFGIIYGQSAFGLSETLGIPRKEAKDIIDAYFEKFSAIRGFMDDTISAARDAGSVSTMYGRIRPIPEINASNANRRSFAERVAVNTRVQGTAADIIKLAMITIQQALEKNKLASKMIIQVHDELVIDTLIDEQDEVENIVRTGMESAAQLKVPLKVDLGVGNNWLEC